MSIAQTQQQNGTQALATNKAAGVKQLLETMKPQLAAVLPKHLTPERLIKVVLTAAIKTPQLYECTRESLMQSVMLAAQLGLDCGGALGSAYLVPYKNVCQLIIGYRGMIDLARRSGQIESINARAVFQGDEFVYEFGLNDNLRHVPLVEPTAQGLTHVYCVAKFKDGGYHLEVMTRKEVDAIRSRSKASGNGPWVTDYVEMAKKTVIRRAFKYLPMSVELQQTLAETVSTDGGQVLGEIIDSTAREVEEKEPEPSRTAQVIQKLREQEEDQDTSPPTGEAPETASKPPAPAAQEAEPENHQEPETSLGDADAQPPADFQTRRTSMPPGPSQRRTSAGRGNIFGGGK